MSQTTNQPHISHTKKKSILYILSAIAILAPTLVFIVMQRSSGGSNLTTIEKAGLEKIATFGGRHELDKDGHINRVMLEGKQVTDEALTDVHALPYLKRLSLQNSSITDQGLLEVAKCKQLQNLGLTNTNLTDAGLQHLYQMVSLQNIWLTENPKLTKRGIAALRKALPPATQIHVMASKTDSKKSDKGASENKLDPKKGS